MNYLKKITIKLNLRMPTRFLLITETEAYTLAGDNTQTYTPGYNSIPKYHFYKDKFETEDEPNIVELDDLEADGLTPIDPTKPIFPKRPK